MDLDELLQEFQELLPAQLRTGNQADANFRCERCVACRECRFCEDCENCRSCTYCETCRDCEACTQCRRCDSCARSSYLDACRLCTDSSYLLLCVDCTRCVHCLGCVGLDDAEFCVLNRKVTRKEYFEIVRALKAEIADRQSEGIDLVLPWTQVSTEDARLDRPRGMTAMVRAADETLGQRSNAREPARAERESGRGRSFSGASTRVREGRDAPARAPVVGSRRDEVRHDMRSRSEYVRDTHQLSRDAGRSDGREQGRREESTRPRALTHRPRGDEATSTRGDSRGGDERHIEANDRGRRPVYERGERSRGEPSIVSRSEPSIASRSDVLRPRSPSLAQAPRPAPRSAGRASDGSAGREFQEQPRSERMREGAGRSPVQPSARGDERGPMRPRAPSSFLPVDRPLVSPAVPRRSPFERSEFMPPRTDRELAGASPRRGASESSLPRRTNEHRFVREDDAALDALWHQQNTGRTNAAHLPRASEPDVAQTWEDIDLNDEHDDITPPPLLSPPLVRHNGQFDDRTRHPDDDANDPGLAPRRERASLVRALLPPRPRREGP